MIPDQHRQKGGGTLLGARLPGEHGPFGTYPAASPDPADLIEQKAIELGWWAVEDRTHPHGWQPVAPGTDTEAVPDMNRVIREHRAWARSARTQSSENDNPCASHSHLDMPGHGTYCITEEQR